jgi:hypothetical protein
MTVQIKLQITAYHIIAYVQPPPSKEYIFTYVEANFCEIWPSQVSNICNFPNKVTKPNLISAVYVVGSNPYPVVHTAALLFCFLKHIEVETLEHMYVMLVHVGTDCE